MTVTMIYSLILVCMSLMAYTVKYVATEELGLLFIDIGAIFIIWLSFCNDETNIGVWNLPAVAMFIRSEIESDKHLAQRLEIFTRPKSENLDEDLLD
jgi:hypothetical protein